MTAPLDLDAIRERARDTALQRSGPLGDAQDFMDGADAASDVWQAEVERLRAALQRVMREADLPAYYGSGSWWNEALEALTSDPAPTTNDDFGATDDA